MTEPRTILKFDVGARGFRRAVLVTAVFASLLLAAGTFVVVSVLRL